MGETAILIWVGVLLVILVNGFAAGVAAMLYIWRRKIRTGGRTALAALAAGIVPGTLIAVIGLSDSSFSGEEPWIIALTFGAFLAIGSVVALPGALVVARKLEAPGDEYRTFE